MRYLIPANHIKLYCDAEGEGEPIVILHGFGQSGKNFAKWQKYLSKEYKVILFDSRNHGRSSKVDAISTALMAEDLCEALRWLKLDRAKIIGYSDGGNTALRLAINHGEVVEKMVIISGNATPSGLIRPFRFMVRIWQLLVEALVKMKIYPKREYNMTRLLTDYPKISEEELKSITTPTMLIFAENDVIGHEHINYLHERISGASLEIIKGTSHFDIADKFDSYIQDILRFFENGDR